MLIVEDSGEDKEFHFLEPGQAFYYEGKHWIKALLPKNVSGRNDLYGAVDLSSGWWSEINPKAFVEIVEAKVVLGKDK